MHDVFVAIGLFAVTFLLGSVPWGVVISKVFFHDDIRKHGSGNIGTTNAMRTLGRAGGAAVFVLDFGKGLLSGALAYLACGLLPCDGLASGALMSCNTMLGVAFFGCTYGHIFSPWLRFKGGKGIAVAVGALFFVYGPAGALLELALFAVVVLVTRYVSAGSIAAAAACPFFALYFFWGSWPAFALCAVVGLTVVWAHRGNIERLRAGTERKIGGGK